MPIPSQIRQSDTHSSRRSTLFSCCSFCSLEVLLPCLSSSKYIYIPILCISPSALAEVDSLLLIVNNLIMPYD